MNMGNFTTRSHLQYPQVQRLLLVIHDFRGKNNLKMFTTQSRRLRLNSENVTIYNRLPGLNSEYATTATTKCEKGRRLQTPRFTTVVVGPVEIYRVVRLEMATPVPLHALGE